MLDLTNAPLFDSLLSFTLDGQTVDLHNEFICVSIIYNEENNVVELLFNKHNEQQMILAQFLNASVSKISINIKDFEYANVLDLFYRGRFLSGDELVDHSKEKGCFFYLGFVNENYFQIFSHKLLITSDLSLSLCGNDSIS